MSHKTYSMLLTRKNSEGFIYAFFEWDIVDQEGRTQNNGNFMYVRDIEVHPSYDGKLVISDFIKELEEDPRNKDVLWIYWKREKRNGKFSRPFRRATALRRLQCLYAR